jgi:hypothetical protein
MNRGLRMLSLFLVAAAALAVACGGSKRDAEDATGVSAGTGGLDAGAKLTRGPDSTGNSGSTAENGAPTEYCVDNPDDYCCDQEHAKEAYCRLYCDEDEIYCVTAAGDPLDDEVPPRVVPGDSVIVRVVADPASLSGLTFVFNGTDSVQDARRKFDGAYSGGGGRAAGGAAGQGNAPAQAGAGGASGAAVGGAGGVGSGGVAGAVVAAAGIGGVAGTAGGVAGSAGVPASAGAGGVSGAAGMTSAGAAGGGGAGGSAGSSVSAANGGTLTCSGSCDQYRIVSYQATAPQGVSEFTVRLTVTRNDTDAVLTDRSYRFAITRGKYFLEAGLIFPVTFAGTREIGTAPFPGTDLRTLEANSDTSWALGLNVLLYPFGVYDTRSSKEDPRSFGVRYFLAPLGIGFGTNLYSDRRIFTEGYFTLNYRIARGAVIGGGVSLVKGEFLKSGFEEGMLWSGSDTSDVIEERYMFRPNLSLTISADVLAGLQSLGNTVALPGGDGRANK